MQITVSHHQGSCLYDLAPPPLLHSELHVWEFPLTASEPEFARAQQLLSEDEQARAARFRFEDLARKFVIARASVRSILSVYVGTTARDLRFTYSEHGKPSLVNNTADIHFNVSHSGDHAMSGVTLGRVVGVDIEAVRGDIELDKLGERFFSDHERQCLRVLSQNEKARAFYRCWTCKEAFLKAQGFGLTRSLDSFDVDLGSGPAHLLATRPDAAEAEQWRLFEVEAPAGYAAAAAVEGSVSALRILRYGAGS